MILYCSAIPALIYPLLVHKLGVNHNEKAVFMYDAGVFESRGFLKSVRSFKTQHLFDDVIGCDMFVDRSLHEPELKAHITEHFDSILKKNGYDIKEFDKIFVLNDTWDGDINLYFNYKEIRYTWIEVVQNYLCGMPNPAMNTSFALIVKKYKSLTPLAKFADACLLEESERSHEKLKYKGYTTWNIKELYESISENDLDIIGKCFSIDKIKNPDKSALVIRNSFGYAMSRSFGLVPQYVKNLNGVTSYNSEEILSSLEKIAFDFYAPNVETRYLKGHPNDSFTELRMKEVYDNNIYSFTDMPFEFVTKYFTKKNIKLNTIIGYSSNSLKNIGLSVCNNLYILGDEFLKSWYYYCSIYTSLLYTLELGICSIYADSIVKSQLELLIKVMDIHIDVYELNLDKINSVENSMIIINCLETKVSGNYSTILPKVQGSNTVCFLNLELAEEFFEGEYSGYFIPLHIHKQNISDNFNIVYDENVWVYSKDQKTRETTRNFQIKKKMPLWGVEFFVEPTPLSVSVKKYKNAELINYRRKCEDLSKEYNILNGRFDKIINILSDNNASDKSSEYIRSSKTFSEFIDLLKIYQSKYLIIMAVRDTPGNCMGADIINNIHSLGFTSFTNELWKMYIGVSYNSKIICNTVSLKREAPLHYNIDNKMDSIEISVDSLPWRNGDKARIIINSEDYSVNTRGLNIVVYDTENAKVIDSVGFDAHYPSQKFIHKRL